MFIPDYDDYYSLTDYAGRFVQDPEECVDAYFSRIATMNLIMVWEQDRGNELFRRSQVEMLCEEIRQGEEKSAEEVLERTNTLSFYMENKKVIADLSIYNDFVAYLLINGIN